MRAVKIKIYGQVQGVGFRWAIRQEAARLGLEARAENVHDGSVEVLASGMAEAINELIEFAKTGPRSARVEKVELIELGVDRGQAPEFSGRE